MKHKNLVNDLTGSEWKFATKSVINKAYPVNLQHKLRSQHGGQKPPDLCSDIIKIFTKVNKKLILNLKMVQIKTFFIKDVNIKASIKGLMI